MKLPLLVALALVCAALLTSACRVFGVYDRPGIPCFSSADCDPGDACSDGHCAHASGGEGEGEGDGGEGDGGEGEGEGEGGPGCSDAGLAFSSRVTIRAAPARCDDADALVPGAVLVGALASPAAWAAAGAPWDTPMPGHAGDLGHFFLEGSGVTVAFDAPVGAASFAFEIVAESSLTTIATPPFLGNDAAGFVVNGGGLGLGGTEVVAFTAHTAAWRDILCFVDVVVGYEDCYVEGAPVGLAVNSASTSAFANVVVAASGYRGAFSSVRFWTVPDIGLTPDDAHDRNRVVAMSRFLETAGIEAKAGSSTVDAVARNQAAAAWATSSPTEPDRLVGVLDESGQRVFVVVAPGWPRVQRSAAHGAELLVEPPASNLVSNTLASWNNIGSAPCRQSSLMVSVQDPSTSLQFASPSCDVAGAIDAAAGSAGAAPVTLSVFMRAPTTTGQITLSLGDACDFAFTATSVTSTCGAVESFGDWLRLSAVLAAGPSARLQPSTSVELWWPQLEVGTAATSPVAFGVDRTADVVKVAVGLTADPLVQVEARAFPTVGRLVTVSPLVLDLDATGPSVRDGNGGTGLFPADTDLSQRFAVAARYGGNAGPSCLASPCASPVFTGGALDNSGVILGDSAATALNPRVGPELFRTVLVTRPVP